MRKEAIVAVGVLVAAGATLGLSSLWQYRGSYETVSQDRLEGFGYTVHPSQFRPDLVRVESRSTAFPFQLINVSIEKGRARVQRDCGGILAQESNMVNHVEGQVTYYSVRNRDGCLASQ